MIVSIGGHPFTPAFYGESCQIGIGHEVAFDVRRPAQVYKNFPMTGPGRDNGTVWLAPEFLSKGDGLFHSAGRGEDFGVGNDAEKSAEYKIRNPIGLFGIDQGFKPEQILGMMRGVFPMSIDENIDVKKDH